jgi:hypothetical protein
LGVSFLVPLFLFKAPRLIRGQLATETFSPSNVVKSLFANHMPASTTTTLLAQTSGEGENVISLEQQNLIDETALHSTNATNPLQQTANTCLQVGNIYSTAELQEELQEIKGGGLVEDVGRYI